MTTETAESLEMSACVSKTLKSKFLLLTFQLQVTD